MFRRRLTVALAVLARCLDDLERAAAAARPLDPGTDARAAWDVLSRLFDVSQGRDLRGLLADSMARQAEAVRRERAAADSRLRAMRAMWLATAAALGLASLLLAAHFARALRRPLDRLGQGARALRCGDLQHRIPEDRPDEFSVVARSVNAMATELSRHREREALARQRLEALVHARTAELQGALEALQQVDARRRRLFADVSHERRTPTTVIHGEAEIALRGRDRPADEYKASLQRIVDASGQLALVIDDLLSVARNDIDALALDRRPIDLAAPLAEALPVLGDAQRLRQLLIELPRVFERTFRGEQARRHRADGIGLGLSIGGRSRARGGEILIDSAPCRGTVATSRLPMMRAAVPEGGPA
jgi:signal transduction histidine kinase